MGGIISDIMIAVSKIAFFPSKLYILYRHEKVKVLLSGWRYWLVPQSYFVIECKNHLRGEGIQ